MLTEKKYINLLEKYRPKTLDGVIGQEKIVESIRLIIKGSSRPHLLFCGPSGVGKTTIARIIAKELGIPMIELNASDERGINVVRTKIKDTTKILRDRVIFLDEADNMTPEAQFALRTIIEKSSQLFILSANYDHKLIPAIKSRCAKYIFEPFEEKHFVKMLNRVVSAEKINIEEEGVDKEEIKSFISLLIKASNGDMRKFLNFLQQIYNQENNTLEFSLFSNPVLDSNLVLNIIEEALAGKFDKSLDAFIQHYKHNKDTSMILNSFHDYFISKASKLDTVLVAGTLMMIAQVEEKLRVGCNPVIQISALIAYIWGNQTGEMK